MYTPTDIEHRALAAQRGMARASAARRIVAELQALRDKAAEEYKASGDPEWSVAAREIDKVALDCRVRLVGEKR